MMLIELEGLDGSGKETQSRLLAQKLRESGYPAQRITFPDYEHPWSVFVQMYLGGEFGSHAGDVNGYTAASFYALDRYASFKKNWEGLWRDGTVIVADRYVGSNLIHQMAKLPQEEWDRFADWLHDFEFQKLGLPRPDGVFFLDVDPQTSEKLLAKRYGGDESKKDIHERDIQYVRACRRSAARAAKREGWQTIPCCDKEGLMSIEAIHQELFRRTMELIQSGAAQPSRNI